ncbi:MAG: AI-2E family transporter [Anaerolineae bacterium]|uniref:AI-2E family transporter n=1 Tax=Promineifilum sp. TaxID=2664178 RepID=UPI001D846B84|nr:AI-2E family transporter [Anaerolineales bacterium]MCB8935412.1 AI-2E family transporter [Promineifilum sp.]MCO5181562.1 AI-2E family transporter [Promineifilum sp.]MCW5846481.1 AI-2E family transporter [Anaerolineae bacterium]
MVEQSKPLLYFLVGIASVFIIIAGIRNLAFILNPILLSLVITITLLPLPAWFAKRGIPGWLSLVLTFLVVLAMIGLVLLIIFVGLAQLDEVLPTLRQTATSGAAAVTDPQGNVMGVQVTDITRTIEDFVASQRFTNVATAVISALFVGLSQAFLVMLIFAFMLSSALALPSSIRLGLRADHPLLKQAATLTEDVRRYITLTTALNFLVGIGNTILLLALGVDLALLWGLLSAFMGYIPAVGFWIAMIPPLLLAFVGDGPVVALLVFAGYVLINGTVENLVKPRMLGRELKISPAVVVIALFVWGWLLGAVGAILSTPLTLLILSILEGFDSSRWITVLLRTAGTGEVANTAEQQAAFGRVRGLWDRGVAVVRGDRPKPPDEG